MAGRLTAPDEVKEKFSEFSAEILEKVPELRSVTLVADWSIGTEDFPAGYYKARETATVTSNSLVGLSQQTLKVLLTQLQSLGTFLSVVAKKEKEKGSKIDTNR